MSIRHQALMKLRMCEMTILLQGRREPPAVIARSEGTKQSILSFCGKMDCFASLAMTEGRPPITSPRRA